MSRRVNTRGYRIELYEDEDGIWVAEVPELPGCLAAAGGPGEAVELLEDAMDAWIDAAVADGRPVPPATPVEDEYSGRFLLRVPKTLHRRLAQEAHREELSLNAYCVYRLALSVGLAEGARQATVVSVPAPGVHVGLSIVGEQGVMGSFIGYSTRGRSTVEAVSSPTPSPYLLAKYVAQR